MREPLKFIELRNRPAEHRKRPIQATFDGGPLHMETTNVPAFGKLAVEIDGVKHFYQSTGISRDRSLVFTYRGTIMTEQSEAAEYAVVRCSDCGRQVYAENKPATGFLATCGKRVVNISDCIAGGCSEAVISHRLNSKTPVDHAELVDELRSIAAIMCSGYSKSILRNARDAAKIMDQAAEELSNNA